MAPHSIRAVPLDYLKEILPYAREHGMRVHMHVAEQPAEVEASVGEYGRRPVELLVEHGVIDEAFTGVHAIHVTDEEVGRFAASGAIVCACPTTERNLGDGIGPTDDLLPAGGSICFGTDSNAQIDLLEDARQLEYHLRLKKLERAVLADDGDRESLARRLFHCATESGARSLGVEVGSLEVGRPADFFTVDRDDLSIAGADQASLLSNAVFAAGRAAIRDVFVGGRAVIEDERQPRSGGSDRVKPAVDLIHVARVRQHEQSVGAESHCRPYGLQAVIRRRDGDDPGYVPGQGERRRRARVPFVPGERLDLGDQAAGAEDVDAPRELELDSGRESLEIDAPVSERRQGEAPDAAEICHRTGASTRGLTTPAG
jgi:hypothetical protein